LASTVKIITRETQGHGIMSQRPIGKEKPEKSLKCRGHSREPWRARETLGQQEGRTDTQIALRYRCNPRKERLANLERKTD